MATSNEVEETRNRLLADAQEKYENKKTAAKEQYDAQMQKIEEMYNKAVKKAEDKYQDFIAKVEEDTDKRLKIVNKVIDAESEERRWKKDQEEQKRQREASERAEQKLREEAEKARQAEEEKQRKLEEKKAAKARKKMLAARAKVPIPPGFVACKNSQSLYKKLKKLNSAGRYAFCCFYLSKDKKFVKYINELVPEYNDNVAWFDCAIKDNNFEEAMLLYEFNGTPCVVICREGKPSNLHRYVIGHNDDTMSTLKRYAEKANQD